MVASLGYHSGELAVQRLAGVTGQAARLAGMVGAGQLSDGLAQFLAGRTFAALCARDRDGIPRGRRTDDAARTPPVPPG
jgi:hypothetical protein